MQSGRVGEKLQPIALACALSTRQRSRDLSPNMRDALQIAFAWNASAAANKRGVPRPTPARVAIVAELLASRRLSSGLADQLVQEGRVNDAAWARVQPLYEELQRERLERQLRDVEAARPVDEDDVSRRIDEAIEALPEAEDRYWAATDIAAVAEDGITISLAACHHYRIWSELTDWYELKPAERRAALAAMQRAAVEWLAAKDDAGKRADYFDGWLPSNRDSA